ncbi:MAG: hypothetical protein HY313_02720 [Acidobacteria bacterium]|nr:hypothetical protein [Acidobacteriota bacterium]
MIKHFLLIVGFVLWFGAVSQAQITTPAFEGFAGFSILSSGSEGDEDIDLDREQRWGWQASLAGNLNSAFGLVADFGGQYKHLEIELPGNDDDFFLYNYQFMFGPRISGRGERATGFGHFLIGGAHTGGSGLEGVEFDSATGLAMGIGGGVDINIGSGGTAFRIIQFDWLPMRFKGDWFQDTFRIGIGIVFRGGM